MTELKRFLENEKRKSDEHQRQVQATAIKRKEAILEERRRYREDMASTLALFSKPSLSNG